MFGFGKKDKSISVRDVIYIAKDRKYKALCNLLLKDDSCKVLCWFEATKTELQGLLPEDRKASVVLADQYFSPPGAKHFFAEHYPLRQQEQELYKSLGIEKAIVFSALQEPLFAAFGGDKIIAMMRQMGMKEDEALENSMITKAIQNAQDKIEKKVLVEQRTRSAEEWIAMNITQENT